MKNGNRLPDVTEVFLLEIMCLRDKAEKTEIRQMEKMKGGDWK